MKPISEEKTTARQLLDLIFEGHEIRAVKLPGGRFVFITSEVAKACGILRVRDIIRNHVSEHNLLSVSVDIRSGNGLIQKRAVSALTQSGVFQLVFGSRKPAARRFSDWLVDDVIPQLISYGTYLPGATPEERNQALWNRARQERCELVLAGRAALKTLLDEGRMTAGAWLQKENLPHTGLDSARLSNQAARLSGEEPERVFTGKRRVSVWPEELLEKAAR